MYFRFFCGWTIKWDGFFGIDAGSCKMHNFHLQTLWNMDIYIYTNLGALVVKVDQSKSQSWGGLVRQSHWRSTVYHFLVTQFWSQFLLKMFNKLNGFKNKNQTEVYAKVASSQKSENCLQWSFFSPTKLLGACFAPKNQENWLAEKQFKSIPSSFLGFRWIYITICGWRVYSLWPKGLQWRCVTWVGFGSFLFNRSVWSVWSLWSGNQLLTPLWNTFFSSRHFCPRRNMLVVPRSSYPSFWHSFSATEICPKTSSFATGRVQQAKGWRNKK